jgi:hypothetical protein
MTLRIENRWQIHLHDTRHPDCKLTFREHASSHQYAAIRISKLGHIVRASISK